MPSNWLSIDSNFPSFTGEEPPQQQIRALHNYLFQLREGLQYSLQNLTADNFNTAALQNLTDAQKNEVTTQLEKVYNVLNQMAAQIDSLSGRVSGTESLSGRVTTAEGEITGLKDRIQLAEENIEGLADWTLAVGDEVDDLKETVTGEGGLKDRIQALEDDQTVKQLQDAVNGEGGLRESTQTLEDAVTGEGGLQEQMQSVDQGLKKIFGAVQVADDGSATIGSEGKVLRLVGQVYINGVLIEQGGTT